MTKSDVTFEKATAEQARAYYGGPPPFTFRGYVAMREGEPIGVGGVYFAGKAPVAFSECHEDMGRKDRARAYRLLETMLKGFKVPVFAVATEPTSPVILTKLGFKQTGVIAAAGAVYKRWPGEEAADG